MSNGSAQGGLAAIVVKIGIPRHRRLARAARNTVVVPARFDQARTEVLGELHVVLRAARGWGKREVR